MPQAKRFSVPPKCLWRNGRGMPQEKTPHVRVVPEGTDYLNFVTYQDRTVFARRFWTVLVGVPALLFGLAIYEFITYGGLVATLKADPAALAVPAVAVLWVLARWQASAKKARRLFKRQPVGELSYRVEADGLAVDTGSRKLKHKWSEMVDVVETDGMMLFVHKREPGVFKATMVPLKSARGEPELFRAAALSTFRGAHPFAALDA